MLCELNECESGGCPRKRELPLDVKKLGGGRQNTLRAGGGGVQCSVHYREQVNGELS